MADPITMAATSLVTAADVRTAPLGGRFGRLDLMSQMAVLAVEWLGIPFDTLARHRIAICLSAQPGSLATDLDFWAGRDAVGGPSPLLFAYTLPSAAVGEIAIRFRLTGPDLCLVGGEPRVLDEAAALIRSGEADACACVSCALTTPAAANLIHSAPAAYACAAFLKRGADGPRLLREIDRDIKTLCALACAPSVEP